MTGKLNTRFWGAVAVLLLLPALVAGAVNTANMKLTGAGSDIAWTSLGGVYISPYTGTIDGVSTTMICDDFGDDTYIGQTWMATPFSVQDAVSSGQTRLNQRYGAFDQATLLMKYTQIADLALLLLSAPTVSDRAAYSFALWGVFDNSAIGTLNDAGLRSKAQTYLQSSASAYLARSADQNASIASAITIYSPIRGTASCCSDPPQEMITVRTPEPSTVVLLAVDLAALGLLVLLLRRHRTRRMSA
jgi:hypothetical protein